MTTKQRVFNYDNRSESTLVNIGKGKPKLGVYANSISACGVLIMKLVGKTPHLLLIKYDDPLWPNLDDFGGKIDEADASIEDAMNREVREETNGIIDLSTLKSVREIEFYTDKSKYLFKVIEVDPSMFEDTSVFGEREFSDDIGRHIKWYPFKEVMPKMAMRLKMNQHLLSFLRNELLTMPLVKKATSCLKVL